MDSSLERLSNALRRYTYYAEHGERKSFDYCLDETLFIYEDIPSPEPKDNKTVLHKLKQYLTSLYS